MPGDRSSGLRPMAGALFECVLLGWVVWIFYLYFEAHGFFILVRSLLAGAS